MTETKMSLAALNAADAAAFDAVAAPLFEYAPWVSAGLAAQRPFTSLTALHGAMMARLLAADEAAQVAFLRGHPALSRDGWRRNLTAESAAEQGAAGLAALDDSAAAALEEGNAAHQAKFGFPFIVAVRAATVATIQGAMARRLQQSAAAELAEGLREVQAISWMRLLDRVSPAPTGSLSLHVLDTGRSRPAAGMSGALWRLPRGEPASCVTQFVTDDHGRAGRMLTDGALTLGLYEWRLDTGAYLAATGKATLDRSFLPEVAVRFGVMNPEEHHHVPVLLTQGAYTTYRGS